MDLLHLDMLIKVVLYHLGLQWVKNNNFYLMDTIYKENFMVLDAKLIVTPVMKVNFKEDNYTE